MECVQSELAKNLAIGASMVTAGVVVKNSCEQMGNPHPAWGSRYIGPTLFVVGWLVVAHLIASKLSPVGYNRNAMLVYGSVAGILLSANYIHKNHRNKMHSIVCAASWLILGYMAGTSDRARKLGIAAAISVLLSMMVAMPWQRANNVVDGPGMPLFVIGWVLLILAAAGQ